MTSHVASVASPDSDFFRDRPNPDDLGSGTNLRWALLILGTIAGALIAEFVQLRENRAFWLDHDLYSARLRGIVLQMFYPLVWMQSFVLGITSLSMLVADPADARAKRLQSAILILLWIVLAGSLFAAVENNLTNVLEGRPLHWHPEDTLAFSSRYR
jgi:hypothetical protein